MRCIKSGAHPTERGGTADPRAQGPGVEFFPWAQSLICQQGPGDGHERCVTRRVQRVRGRGPCAHQAGGRRVSDRPGRADGILRASCWSSVSSAARPPSRSTHAARSRPRAQPRSSKRKGQWKWSDTTSRVRPSSSPLRGKTATGSATSCSTTRAARTASTAGCFPGTATTERLSAAARVEQTPSRPQQQPSPRAQFGRAVSTCESVSGRASMRARCG